jgi:ribosomal protein S18 acetylase RimI-like enzyme
MQFSSVVTTNERAVRFWESFGFDILGRQALEYPTEGFVDALVMWRAL